jgi:hypothetical protein
MVVTLLNPVKSLQSDALLLQRQSIAPEMFQAVSTGTFKYSPTSSSFEGVELIGKTSKTRLLVSVSDMARNAAVFGKLTSLNRNDGGEITGYSLISESVRFGVNVTESDWTEKEIKAQNDRADKQEEDGFADKAEKTRNALNYKNRKVEVYATV